MSTRDVMENLHYARGVGIITRGAIEPRLKTRAFRSDHARREAVTRAAWAGKLQPRAAWWIWRAAWLYLLYIEISFSGSGVGNSATVHLHSDF
ncbi:hypothetical protein L195_g028715 [Trifolium pratense]|uniref:Uncharacterized protein n=1 Tax=Trifolium pratense TaxID=57577 RepID=A0A2K3L2S6_TRIPR|nr:hypothetical protein L195_g028715 [Trifolium pratense]